jgi:hypothetical protein
MLGMYFYLGPTKNASSSFRKWDWGLKAYYGHCKSFPSCLGKLMPRYLGRGLRITARSSDPFTTLILPTIQHLKW